LAETSNYRRDFYPQVIGALTEILAFLDDPASFELLDHIVFGNLKKLENVSQGARDFGHLRKINHRRVDLLASMET
jgi:hypothetical protein